MTGPGNEGGRPAARPLRAPALYGELEKGGKEETLIPRKGITQPQPRLFLSRSTAKEMLGKYGFPLQIKLGNNKYLQPFSVFVINRQRNFHVLCCGFASFIKIPLN